MPSMKTILTKSVSPFRISMKGASSSESYNSSTEATLGKRSTADQLPVNGPSGERYLNKAAPPEGEAALFVNE